MQLINDDCLKAMNKLIEEGIVFDACITDPPYGTTHNKWDSPIPLNEMWEKLHKLIKPNGAIVLFGQDKFTAKVMLSNEKEHRYNLIWKKGERTSGFLNAKRMPLRNHEDIMVFYQKLPVYHPQFTEGQPLHGKGNSYLTKECTNNNYGKFNQLEAYRKGSTQKFPKSIINFDRPHPPIHPTQRPVELMEWLIKTYTNEGDLILDFTMGIGTTGIACAKTNRDFVGIELNKEYFSIAEQKIRGIRDDL